MTEGRHFENIALIGFMGTGKSTVGQLAAGMLGFRFVDTDEMIERMAGKRITDIFASDGEARFREHERDIVAKLREMTRTVVSTGGGLVTNPENLASLKEHALTVCLWCSAETILKRVGHQTHRPLLRVENPLEKIRALLNERAPAYRQADVLLSSEFRKPKEVAMHVVHEYRAVRGKNGSE
ncbi:MAG TPA: shikimate kinase [Verrucomicrobiae bacterium]